MKPIRKRNAKQIIRILAVLLACPFLITTCIDQSWMPPVHGYQVSLVIVNDLDYNIILETNLPRTFVNNTKNTLFIAEITGKGERRHFWDKYSDTVQVSSYEEFSSIISNYVSNPFISVYRARKSEKAELVGTRSLSNCEVTMSIVETPPAPLQTRLLAVDTMFRLNASSLME